MGYNRENKLRELERGLTKVMILAAVFGIAWKEEIEICL